MFTESTINYVLDIEIINSGNIDVSEHIIFYVDPFQLSSEFVKQIQDMVEKYQKRISNNVFSLKECDDETK